MNTQKLLFKLAGCGTLSLAAANCIAAGSPLLRLHAVAFTEVKIADAFWYPRQETNRIASIPINYENLEKAGNLQNLRLAAQRATSNYQGAPFIDPPVYKAIAAAACSQAARPDPMFEKKLDEIIVTIAAAQQPDGYLNTYFTLKEPGKRWTNLRDAHELFAAGHLFEAAVAYYQAAGKRALLNVATKFADHIDSVFDPPPKRLGYPGHPEIELALVKLWRATGEQRYVELARFFVENRGRHYFATEHNTPLEKYDGSYWQDDVPVYDHNRIKGHAVRAAYLMSGVTDVAAETGDERLLKMLTRVWRNTTEANLYLTGGIGSSRHNEGFTTDYDLPNLTAYQETCATIALAQWSHRLALLYGDARYADVMERTLYNGLLAGMSLDGKAFFYVNRLESNGDHHRNPWYGTPCCPPNVARTLASLGDYAYATGDGSLYVNLYIQGEVRAKVAGQEITLKVKTDYPWDGKVSLRLNLARPAKFSLHLREPEWSQHSHIFANKEDVSSSKSERGYRVLSSEWKDGDTVELEFAMPVQRIAAHPKVKADQGLLAIQRGPIIYCVEQCDLKEPLASLFVPADAELEAVVEKQLLGGVTIIKGFAGVVARQHWTNRLYQPLPAARRVPLTAIPYYAWDNREAGPMKVWLPVTPTAPE